MREMTALLLKSGLTPRDVTLSEAVTLWEMWEDLALGGLA